MPLSDISRVFYFTAKVQGQNAAEEALSNYVVVKLTLCLSNDHGQKNGLSHAEIAV